MHVPNVVLRPHLHRPTVRGVLRVAVLLAVLLGLLLTTSWGHLGQRARAALRDAPSGSATAPATGVPMRAVVIVGPVGGLTSSYLARGRSAADAAERNGMEVTRIFHPRATWSRVVAAANGAHLLVYLGHGNGWPSPHGPFQEDTKNGFGLNPTLGETDAHRVRYFGANRIRESIRLAPDAVVILGKACYAAGNGEEGAPIPTRSVAHQRVDNYAAGFLAVGAGAVFALTWQPAASIVEALFAGPSTMDGIFMTRLTSGSGPSAGWVGWRPDLVLGSLRTPGARVRLDPDPEEGYLRALSGDLALTTDEWLAGAAPAPDDTTPPIISDVAADRPTGTFLADAEGPTVLTPNGDGISETLVIRHTVSEPAFLDVEVERVSNGNIVRRMTGWAREGRSGTTWDGRKDSGDRAADGRYRIRISPRDRAGNVGEGAVVTARVLTALRAPRATPGFFDPTDGDDLGSVTFSARLTKPADISWRVLDESGQLVRSGPEGVSVSSDRTSFTWDGRDDAGVAVARGRYRARVTATTAQGTYGHSTSVVAQPFLVTSDDWTIRRGQTVRLGISAAEAVAGKPTVTVRQPGLPEWTLRVRTLSDTSFRAPLTAQAGGSDGRIRVTITSTDTEGGTQSRTVFLRLR